MTTGRPHWNRDGQFHAEHFTHAWHFFQALSSASGRLVSLGDSPAYLYRGQGRARLPLLPVAFRSDRKLLRGGRWTSIRELRTNADQLSAECETLAAFFDIADRSGLPIPEDSQELRTTLRDLPRRFAL